MPSLSLPLWAVVLWGSLIATLSYSVGRLGRIEQYPPPPGPPVVLPVYSVGQLQLGGGTVGCPTRVGWPGLHESRCVITWGLVLM